MPTIIYVQPDGTRETAEGVSGRNVMSIAVRAGIEGIVAQCNGCCICGTCHVYVDPAWLHLLPPVSADEDSVLDGVAAGRQDHSRLGCQIPMTPALDGLIVHVLGCQL